MKGRFKLNVNGEQPAIDLSLSTGFLDTSYFNSEPYKKDAPDTEKPAETHDSNAHPYHLASLDRGTDYQIFPQADTVTMPESPSQVEPPKPATGLDDLIKNNKSKSAVSDNAIYKRWSENLIDMSWLGGISGTVDLSIGKLIYKDLVFNNVKIQNKFGNNLMTFNTLLFSYWGGQCSVTGSIYGGKVPGFVSNISLTDMHLGDMLKDLTGRDNVYGNFSLNASLNTSGVNVLSWVTQAEGKMVFVGRGVTTQGLNLPAVVDAVAASRTAADVVNNVGKRLVDGATVFSVDGNVNLKNGILRTPGLVLRSNAIVGNMIGEVRLVSWNMDFTTMFQFPELTTETVPTMNIQLSGPLKSGEMHTDTSSLEAYVAKRIISK